MPAGQGTGAAHCRDSRDVRRAVRLPPWEAGLIPPQGRTSSSKAGAEELLGDTAIQSQRLGSCRPNR